MIYLLKEARVTHSRDAKPQYARLGDMEPSGMRPSRYTRYAVELDIAYDRGHSELVDRLFKSVEDVLKEVIPTEEPKHE